MKIIRIYTVTFLCLIGMYLLLTLLIPPDDSVLTKYGITSTAAKFLGLTVTVPLIAIWTAAFIGLRRITRYAIKIRNEADGEGFWYLSLGLTVLVIGLPINSIIAASSKYFARIHPDFLPASVIINNYLSLALLLTGFLIISKGTRLLLQRTTNTPVALSPIWRAVIVLFSVGFVYTTLSNPSRSQAVNGVTEAAYYLPDWLIIITIIIPYIYIWYIGILGAHQLRQYSQKVSGLIYRHALKYISTGLIFVIGASILLRLLSRLNAFFQEAQLQQLLLIIYLLLLFISIGYIYIAVGAKKLKKIEDV